MIENKRIFSPQYALRAGWMSKVPGSLTLYTPSRRTSKIFFYPLLFKKAQGPHTNG